ncbi:hypothetical protein M427DRAFT_129848 [Gonapodya prolifera JEL478]|uniref:Uncharacterized protein n=1 Tax=Gonapodya prolifera (strain JEL478) TaxID=1344416 RepID=A0A139AZD5_GONPJ|nr:hypothetical protein M427DRAFT_129848 [Gonapodya prolifera JEL478]|eukprot:KXS22079.1 hypothetical protein M427DRAFT_129848 [Gonapodya prolifera JEL478]
MSAPAPFGLDSDMGKRSAHSVTRSAYKHHTPGVNEASVSYLQNKGNASKPADWFRHDDHPADAPTKPHSTAPPKSPQSPSTTAPHPLDAAPKKQYDILTGAQLPPPTERNARRVKQVDAQTGRYNIINNEST